MQRNSPAASHASPSDGASSRRAHDAASVLDALRSIVRELRLASDEAGPRVGISRAQLLALRQVADNPHMSLTELADRTHTDISSASVVVSRLVEQGLVVRRPTASDRRRLSLTPTTRGRVAARRAPDAEAVRLASGASRLGDRDLHALAISLAKLAAGLREDAD